jgi:tetratricopeptide (TPR) repeat protein
MLRHLTTAARGLSCPFRAARRRPWVAAAAVVCALAAIAAAGVGHVYYQWDAAQLALAEGRPAEARARLGVCLFLWPRDPEVHLLAARACRLSGDPRAAEAHLNECLKLPGGTTRAVQLEFLLLRVQTGEVDEVASPLIDAVEKGSPDSPLILETLARAYMHRLRYRAAYACLSRWIEIQPGLARPYQWRGWVLERMNRAKAASEDYRRALERDPDLLPVRLRVAEMLVEDKRTPEALPHAERLYRQAPDNPQVQALLGICRYYQNEPAEARRLMEAAVRHLPKDPPLLIHLARLDLQEGRAGEAEKRLRHVLQADRSDTEALHGLVDALRLQGRDGEAAATLKLCEHYKERLDRANRLLREVADSPGATAADYADIGRLLLDIGRDRLGVYWLERALELEPGHRAAHAALATYYDRNHEPERAAAHRRWLPPGDGAAGGARAGARAKPKGG